MQTSFDETWQCTSLNSHIILGFFLIVKECPNLAAGSVMW